ncbi:hypothetical protein EVAR_29404_1 [Eumeta japonica]|uniref:Uncharacterized protein n=1 Tax=Eumeta variegata TaxID=151549 RepID=A0A4C1VV16_EUMVA|nr:hypothetical protein EVAR_29404_1 [Eumeta japonica]
MLPSPPAQAASAGTRAAGKGRRDGGGGLAGGGWIAWEFPWRRAHACPRGAQVLNQFASERTAYASKLMKAHSSDGAIFGYFIILGYGYCLRIRVGSFLFFYPCKGEGEEKPVMGSPCARVHGQWVRELAAALPRRRNRARARRADGTVNRSVSPVRTQTWHNCRRAINTARHHTHTRTRGKPDTSERGLKEH